MSTSPRVRIGKRGTASPTQSRLKKRQLPPAAKPPHDHNTSQSETHSTFWHGRLNTARMHTRPSCKPLLWRSSEPPPAQRSMINHNSLLSCRSSTHIYLVHSPTHNTVVKILKIIVFMIHSLPCTVSNEMKTNQFYEPQPYFPTDVEPCHSLPLCLLEFLRGTINHINQRVHYNELIQTSLYRTGNGNQKKK